MPGRLPPRARRLRTTAVAAAACLTLVTTSCSLFGDDDGDKADRSTTSEATTTTTVAPGPPPEVMDFGAAPRQRLRLALEAGTTSSVTVTTDLSLSQDDGATTRTFDPPPIAQTIEVRVASADSDGSDLRFEVTDATVASSGTDLTPAEVVKLTAELKPIVGITGRGHLTPDGRMDAVRFTVPDGAPDEVADRIEQVPGQLAGISPRLPTQPVGVGARWRTTDTSTLNGIETEQTTTVHVTAIDDGRITYETTVAITAPAQDLPTATGTKDGGGRLLSSTYDGTGTGVLRLDRPVSEAVATVSGRQELSPTEAKAGATVSQVIKVVTRVRVDA